MTSTSSKMISSAQGKGRDPKSAAEVGTSRTCSEKTEKKKDAAWLARPYRESLNAEGNLLEKTSDRPVRKRQTKGGHEKKKLA